MKDNANIPAHHYPWRCCKDMTEACFYHECTEAQGVKCCAACRVDCKTRCGRSKHR